MRSVPNIEAFIMPQMSVGLPTPFDLDFVVPKGSGDGQCSSLQFNAGGWTNMDVAGRCSLMQACSILHITSEKVIAVYCRHPSASSASLTQGREDPSQKPDKT